MGVHVSQVSEFGTKYLFYEMYTSLQSHQLNQNTYRLCMPCTGQLGGPVLKAFGRMQKTLYGPSDKSPMITDQHTEGGSVSQLSQLTKLSHWLTLSRKYITAPFWHYNKWVLFLYARLKNGTYYAVAMSVRPFVHPSVRPSAFSGLFFNMLWDINLKLGIYIL